MNFGNSTLKPQKGGIPGLLLTGYCSYNSHFAPTSYGVRYTLTFSRDRKRKVSP